MKKNKILIISFIFIIFLSNLSFATKPIYTVDDVRDIVGQERNDGKFSANEIAEIISKYKAIEKKNLYAKMFELGKEIDINYNI
jgi:hypothetical protein